MIYRVTAGVTVVLFLVFGATALLAPSRVPPPEPGFDHVRLLDRLENARKLVTPWAEALRRRRAAPAPRAPDWERLDSGATPRSIAAVEAHVEANRQFVEIRARDPHARSLALRWQTPVETGRTYQVTLEVAIPMADRRWAPELVAGSLRAHAAPTVRFGPEPANGGGGDHESIRCRADAAAFGAESAPAVLGEDPMEAARRELERLHRLNRVKPLVEKHLDALAREGKRHDLWFGTTIRFTAPPGSSHALLGLDLDEIPGPLPVRWECARLVAGGDLLADLPGTYRYARTHGDTVFVKRMVKTPTDHRLSLVLAPPTVIGIDVTFPPRAELRFGVKAEPPPGAADTDPSPSRLVIEAVLANGERVRLHEEVVAPAGEAPAVWADRTVSCAAVAGRTGRLRFRVDADRPDRGVVVAVSDPILHRPGRGKETPSVVLVTVDSLRFDAVGRKVNGQSLTPNLDAFATRAVKVSHAISGGLNTFVAMPGLMTGHPILGPEAGLFAERLRVGVPALADVLAASGRFVRAVSPDPYLHSVLKGFHRRAVEKPIQVPAMTDARRVADALAFLESHRHDPFFLWLHLDDPHIPCLPKPEDAPAWEIPGVPDPGPRDPVARFKAACTGLQSPSPEARAGARRYCNAAYQAEVRYADAWVGKVLGQIARLGLESNTVVIIHADHGVTVGGEHFGWRDFHDGTIRVPLLMRFPGGLPAGVERRGVMSLVDVAPTLLDLLGIPRPLEWSDRSRLAWLRGEAPRTRNEPELFAGGWALARYNQRAVIRTLDWWYLADLEGASPEGKGTLLRCGGDDTAWTDVSADHPTVVKALDARMRQAIREGRGGYVAGHVSESMKRFLRETGYLPAERKEGQK